MRINKVTSNENLRWESSRMMLPEHREEILRSNKKELKKSRPTLATEQQEIFAEFISNSMRDGLEIAVSLFDEYGDRELSGVVTRIDQQQRKIKLVWEDDFAWIHFDDVIKITDSTN